jgi:hypothetical protein
MSQKLEIVRHLAKGHRLTPLQALGRFGTLSLSQRIGELRREGWPIRSRLVEVGEKRVAEYRLEKPKGRKS